MSPRKTRSNSIGRNNKRQNSNSPNTSPNDKQKSKAAKTTDSNTMSAITLDQLKSIIMDTQTESITNLLNTKTSELKEQLQSTRMELKTEIQQISESIKTEMKTELLKVNEKIDSTTELFEQKIISVNKNVSECIQRIEDSENDLDRLVLMNEVKFVGVPPTDNENLQGIFNSIAAFLGFDTTNPTNLPSLIRLNKHDPSTGALTPSQVIVAKFVAIHIKERFYGLYLNKLSKKENLSTSDLGLSFQKRIIIGENLTAHNLSIFIAASKYKRDQKLSQVYTVSGLVNVKLQRGTKPYIIKHLHELEVLVNNAPTQPAEPNIGNTNNIHPTPSTTNEQSNNPSFVNQQPNNSLVNGQIRQQQQNQIRQDPNNTSATERNSMQVDPPVNDSNGQINNT